MRHCILAAAVVLSLAGVTRAQSADEIQRLKDRIDLLETKLKLAEKENELLRREIELLKEQKGVINKGNSTETRPAAALVTVDEVEWEYGGHVRGTTRSVITLYATSKNGNKVGSLGAATLIDEEGNKHTGLANPTNQPALAAPALREGVRTKQEWHFRPLPVKLKKATLLSITRGLLAVDGADNIEFRDASLEPRK
jgi:hypothetical protein